MTAYADLPARVVTRDSCFALSLNHVVLFPLVGRRTPNFPDWPFSASLPDWRTCWAWYIASCSESLTVVDVASDVSTSMSLHSSILHLLYASELFKKTSKLLQNSIELNQCTLLDNKSFPRFTDMFIVLVVALSRVPLLNVVTNLKMRQIHGWGM